MNYKKRARSQWWRRRFPPRWGEILALIGPNGAGKASCFNMIAGAMPPTEGRVVFNGRDVTRHKPCHLNAHGMARTRLDDLAGHEAGLLSIVLIERAIKAYLGDGYVASR